MTQWWLLHGVGEADLGVSSASDNTERVAQREQRLRLLTEITDPAELGERLARLRWDPPVTGELSPLAAATRALAADDPVRLVLVATTNTRRIADALVTALSRAPEAFNLRLPVEVAQVDGTETSGGLAEHEVTAALAPYLHKADPDVRVLITWGSGSTQLALGSVEAAIRARVPWMFANVGSPPPADPYVVLDPGEDLDVDPLVPLVRRWRYHDLLAHMIESAEITVSEQVRREVLANVESWRRAHMHPTAQNLRLLMTDALMRGDATSGFAVRAYVLAQYRQFREQEQSPFDLLDWAQRKLPKAQLGDIVQLIRNEKTHHEVTRAKDARSGKWLIEDARILNKAGVWAAHLLAPPPAALRKDLRTHLAAVSADPATSDAAALLSATGAWYVAIVGEGATRPGLRPHPLQVVAEARAEKEAAQDAAGQRAADARADPEIAEYLGERDPTAVDRRYLVLGTRQGSAADAVELARRINAATDPPGEVAVAGTLPDPDATPPFDTDTAYELLGAHFQRVRTEVGALVLVPTGLKPLTLPLLMAGLRLTAQEGIPLFLRQMAGGAMHLLPVHFGIDSQLLGLARHALDVLELDVAIRLLRNCSAGREFAIRADRLRRALRSEDPAHGVNWPAELPRDWSRQDRSTRLAGQRVEIWSALAKADQEPAHAVRAVMGAHAVLEQSIRTAAPPQLGGGKKPSEQAWKEFTKRTRLGACSGNHHAKALGALLDVRNKVPISHGEAFQDLDVLIGCELGSPRPVPATDLLRLVVEALRRRFGDASAGAGTPRLSVLLDQLRADVSEARNAELARLARTQVADPADQGRPHRAARQGHRRGRGLTRAGW